MSTGLECQLPESLRGIHVVDVDTHLSEPADLWVSRAPARYRDRVPRVVKIKDQSFEDLLNLSATDSSWVVDDDIIMGQAGGGSVVNGAGEKIRGQSFIQWPIDAVSPAASYVQPRLQLMDDFGIWAQIVYPNVVGFGGDSYMKIRDPELRDVCCRIWNDAMVEMSEESEGRINGMAILPWWDQAGAAREAERIHGLGLKGVNISADPQNFGVPALSDPSWDRLWDICEGLSLPVNFHIGASQTQNSWFGSASWPTFTDDVRLALGSSIMYLSNARILGNLIFSGICDRYPRLKFVSVESGIGWIPFMLEALDYQAIENGVRHLAMKPSEYFYRQFYACFWFESGSALIRDIERLGYENCMFETDFPHPTCLYPDPLAEIGGVLGDLPFEARQKVLSANAARVYSLDLPADDAGCGG